MSEKKKRKEIDNEPVGSVSLQRNKDWSWTVIQGLYNLDSLLFLCFMTFFYFWNTKSGLLGGGEPPTFLEENCFCLSIRDMLKAEYLSFYTLSRLRFLERYLIENVANTMSESRFLNFLGEDSPRPPPLPKKLASPARVIRGSPQLKLRSAVPANDSLRVFPKKSKLWWSPSLWSLNSLLAVPRPQ